MTYSEVPILVLHVAICLVHVVWHYMPSNKMLIPKDHIWQDNISEMSDIHTSGLCLLYLQQLECLYSTVPTG